MKRLIFFLILITIFIGCRPKQDGESTSILPTNFIVDIPSSLSADQPPQNKKNTDTIISGEELYNYLRYFINVGEKASQIVQDIINTIHKYNLSQDATFSFTGEDQQIKNVIIKSNISYDGETWKYGLQITDANSETNQDGGIAIQIYWNKFPVKGIAILKPLYINTQEYETWTNTMIKIYYSEAEPTFYEQYMVVSITELPQNTNDRFAIRNLKMFVGKQSTRTDVFGNSQHPNAWILIPENKGYNWAFVASAIEAEEIAVAEVGLPSDMYNSSSRRELLEDYSLYNVLKEEIKEWYYQENGTYPDSLVLEQYLVNAKAPAHFTNNGFLPAQLAINPMFTSLEDHIKILSPYNPYQVAIMNISFAPFPTN